MNFLDAIGGRKLLLNLLVIALGVGIEMGTSRGLTTNLLTLLLGICGSFTVGNMGEHFARGRNGFTRDEEMHDKLDGLAEGMPDLAPLDAKVDAIGNAVLTTGNRMAVIQGSMDTIQKANGILLNTLVK